MFFAFLPMNGILMVAALKRLTSLETAPILIMLIRCSIDCVYKGCDSAIAVIPGSMVPICWGPRSKDHLALSLDSQIRGVSILPKLANPKLLTTAFSEAGGNVDDEHVRSKLQVNDEGEEGESDEEEEKDDDE
ncbi:hypothetical protein POTOM_029917 [Populus tomentosa]|uniref:Uncharacterized protein n=1 Tax=Populus tomentosa TaxID=118781 RepID=A0A8X8CUF5_POPTO|nr:hypothetical protein POTOM_029917 [Populus tomentosa]